MVPGEKKPVEIGEIRESGLRRDGRNAFPALPQELSRKGQPQPDQIVGESDPDRPAEKAAKTLRLHPDDRGNRGECQLLLKMPLQEADRLLDLLPVPAARRRHLFPRHGQHAPGSRSSTPSTTPLSSLGRTHPSLVTGSRVPPAGRALRPCTPTGRVPVPGIRSASNAAHLMLRLRHSGGNAGFRRAQNTAPSACFCRKRERRPQDRCGGAWQVCSCGDLYRGLAGGFG